MSHPPESIRTRESRARSEITAISLVTALCLAGDSFLYIALPLHWEEAGLASLFEVGLVLAANRVVRLPLNPLVTRLYGRCSCRAGFLLACLFAAVSTAGYGLGQGLLAWLLLRFLWGLAWTLLRLGTLFVLVRAADPGSLGRLTGINNGLYRLGSLAGMLLGGLLADAFGLQASALIFAALALPAPFLLMARVSAWEPERGADGAAPARGAGLMPRDGREWWVMMTAFAVAMTFQGVTASTISVLLEGDGSGGVVLFGLTLGAAGLSGLLQSLRWAWEPFLAPAAGRLSDRRGRARVTAWSFALAAAAMACAVRAVSLPALCAGLVLVQLSATVLTTAADALGNDQALRADNPRHYLSRFALFTDLGAAAGPLLAYAVAGAASVEAAWTMTALALALFAMHWMRRGDEPGPRVQ